MALKKCPICELNYLKSGQSICAICQTSKKQLGHEDEQTEICANCGEHPCLPGYDVCSLCLKEKLRDRIITQEDFNKPEMPQANTSMHGAEIELDDIGTLEIEAGTDIPEEELQLIKHTLLEDDDNNASADDQEVP